MIYKMMLMAILTFPEISIAIGTVESRMDHKAVGDQGRSRGAFQVQSRIWGKVPAGLKAQMRQHNDIMLELLRASNGDIPATIRRYNGRGKATRRYLGMVTREALERELLPTGT